MVHAMGMPLTSPETGPTRYARLAVGEAGRPHGPLPAAVLLPTVVLRPLNSGLREGARPKEHA